MATTPRTTRGRAAERAQAQTDADAKHRLERLAWLLDSSIPVPGTKFRFGLDPLIGLLPGLGDLIGLGVSSYILAAAARLGAPRSVLVRMAMNVGIDTLVGIVPVAGDLFDAVWKANQRNVRLLEGYFERPTKVRRASQALVFLLVAALAFVLFVIALLVFVFLRWLFTTAFGG